MAKDASSSEVLRKLLIRESEARWADMQPARQTKAKLRIFVMENTQLAGCWIVDESNEHDSVVDSDVHYDKNASANLHSF